MEMLRLVIVVLAACISSIPCEVNVQCDKTHASCQCQLNGNVNTVLFYYPPFLEPSNSSSLESMVAKKVTRLAEKNVLDCYNLKKCFKSEPAKNQVPAQLVVDEYELMDKIEDNNINLVYPIPVEIYQEIMYLRRLDQYESDNGDDSYNGPDDSGDQGDYGHDDSDMGFGDSDDQSTNFDKVCDYCIMRFQNELMEYMDDYRKKSEMQPPQTGERFIAIKESKNQVVYINVKKCRGQRIKMIFSLLYQQWPIISVIFLMAAISGIIIWILESGRNKEFASSFYPGCLDGAWWSFISITTVGYGDKTPRSLVGRMFGVVWILVGIVVFTFGTAAITSAITIVTVKKSCHQIDSQAKVAVLRGTGAEDYISLKNLGKPEVYNFTEENVFKMFDELNKDSGSIDFFMISPLVASYYFTELQKRTNIKRVQSIKTISDPEVLYYIMIRFKLDQSLSKAQTFLADRVCKRDHFIDDVDPNNVLLGNDAGVSNVDDEVAQILSITSPETEPLILEILLPTFGGLVVLGVLLEICKGLRKGRRKKDDVGNEEMMMQERPSPTVAAQHPFSRTSKIE